MAFPGRSALGVGRRSAKGVCAAGGPETFDVTTVEDIAVEFTGEFILFNATDDPDTIISKTPATIDLGPFFTTAMLKAWGNQGDNVVPSFLRSTVFDGAIDPPNDDASDFTPHPEISAAIFQWNGLLAVYNDGISPIAAVVDTGTTVELHGQALLSVGSSGDLTETADGVLYFNPTVDTTFPPFDKTATAEQIMFYATGMGGLTIRNTNSGARDAHFVQLHMIATFSV